MKLLIYLPLWSVLEYLYGALSVIVISVLSLISILIVGRINQSKKSIILSLKALAMGTLLSDALIHLIPSALGLHVHSDGEHDEHDHGGEAELDEKTVIYRTTVILSSKFCGLDLVILLKLCF